MTTIEEINEGDLLTLKRKGVFPIPLVLRDGSFYRDPYSFREQAFGTRAMALVTGPHRWSFISVPGFLAARLEPHPIGGVIICLFEGGVYGLFTEDVDKVTCAKSGREGWYRNPADWNY